MLTKRMEKLKKFIEYLSNNYYELNAIPLLLWIDLYRNILSSNNLMSTQLTLDLVTNS